MSIWERILDLERLVEEWAQEPSDSRRAELKMEFIQRHSIFDPDAYIENTRIVQQRCA